MTTRRQRPAEEPRLDSEISYWDRTHGCVVTKVFPGEWRLARTGEALMTVLGSCVAACVRHPSTGRAGMNHFLLAGAPRRPEEGGSPRYGAAAMEALVGEVLRFGGQPRELEVKVFGGSALGCAARIGTDNAAFVVAWLRAMGIPLVAWDLGGRQPRKLLYLPDSGRVMVQRLSGRLAPEAPGGPEVPA